VTTIDVDVPMEDGTAAASLHVPEGSGPWPAVIMYPDAGSTRGVFREMADRLAGEDDPASPHHGAAAVRAVV
jgi:dienelactone hydrolase